jgi:hypothetical protein
MAVTIEHCRRSHPWADVLPTLLPDSTEPDTVDEMVPRELLNIKNQLIHLENHITPPQSGASSCSFTENAQHYHASITGLLYLPG